MKRLLLAVMVLSALAGASFAATVASGDQVGTISNAANWLVSFGAVVDVTPFQHGDNIALTDNSTADGTPVSGGLSTFNGYWIATYTFTLPADITNVVLSFDDLEMDDRGALLLNEVEIGAAGIDGAGNPYIGADGQVQLVYGGSTVTRTFASSGLVNSGFVIGGLNTLKMIVNNTNSGYSGSTLYFQESEDGTAAGFNATITFDPAGVDTPEPGAASMLLLGLGALVPVARKLRRAR